MQRFSFRQLVPGPKELGAAVLQTSPRRGFPTARSPSSHRRRPFTEEDVPSDRQGHGAALEAGQHLKPPWLAAAPFGLTELLLSKQHEQLEEKQPRRPGPASELALAKGCQRH